MRFNSFIEPINVTIYLFYGRLNPFNNRRCVSYQFMQNKRWYCNMNIKSKIIHSAAYANRWNGLFVWVVEVLVCWCRNFYCNLMVQYECVVIYCRLLFFRLLFLLLFSAMIIISPLLLQINAISRKTTLMEFGIEQKAQEMLDYRHLFPFCTFHSQYDALYVINIYIFDCASFCYM